MLSNSLTYQIFSDLIESILESKQFVFKLISHCKKKNDQDPIGYCKEHILQQKNVTLVLRSDEKLWTFREDPLDLFIDLKTLSATGRMAVTLLIDLMCTVSKKDPQNNLVYMTEFRNVEFFNATFISCMESKLEELFSSIK
jgi:hypothetical protein